MDDLFGTRGSAKPPWHGKLPSQQLAEYLKCEVAEADVQPAIKSWARFYYHDAAKQVLKIETKDGRGKALAKIPAPIRHHVENEVRRLWGMRLGTNR